MAPIESSPSPNSRAIAGWPNALAALYTLLLFVALRVVSDDFAQKVCLALAGVAYAACVAGRVRGRLSADADGKKLLLLVGGPADTLLLVGGALCAYAELGDKVPELVLAAGVLSVVAGAGMTLALELVTGPMRATGFVDNRRVQAAARTAATLVVAAAALGSLCFAVEKLDVRRDFSFAAPTTPSAATRSMLEAGSCGPEKTSPEVFLFFDRGSTALGEVRDYFEGLEQLGALVTTQDAAVDPTLAKQLKVSKNGTIGFRCGTRTESYVLGDDREEAQRKLNKIDEEVRTRLAKITKDAVNVYFVVGHGERVLDENAKGGERPSAKGLKRLIEMQNGKLKKLGVADGLTKEVPADAALVIVAGPTQPFMPAEVYALETYVRNGGSLLLLLDPKLPTPDAVDVTAELEPLLATLGVKVGTHEILNDKAFVKNSNTAADHAFLYSTSFGNHKSVKTLSGARGKAALFFLSAASVDKRDASKDAANKDPHAAAPKDAKDAPKVSMIARTPAASFIDVNDSRAWDEKEEARAVLDLAAAIELPKLGSGPKDKEGRAIVSGDSDVLADMLITQNANEVFAYELLLWLMRDDDKLGGGVTPEEDVPIRHSRDEDTAWFYLTIFTGPVLSASAGITFIQLRRRRRAARASS